MDSYCSHFNYSLWIIMIGPSCYVVFLSSYFWLKLYYFPDSRLWRNFFILPKFRVTLVCKILKNCLTAYEGHVIFQVLISSDDLSFKSYQVWCWPFYLLVNTITLKLVVDHTYKFIHGMTIPHLTYWTNAQMDVTFAKSYSMF